MLRSLDFYTVSALTKDLCKYLAEEPRVSEGTGWTLRYPVVTGKQPMASRSRCLPRSRKAPLLFPVPCFALFAQLMDIMVSKTQCLS